MTVVPAIEVAIRQAFDNPELKAGVMDAKVLQNGATRLDRGGSGAPVPILGVFAEQELVSDDLANLLADFIVLPSSFTEVRIRIARLLKAHPDRSSDRDFNLDPAMGASYRGREIGLTRGEHRMLAALVDHRGLVLSKQQLLRLCDGYDGYNENVVEVRISRLRRKLRSVGAPSVETVRGFGYRLAGLAPPGNGSGPDPGPPAVSQSTGERQGVVSELVDDARINHERESP